MGTERLSHMTWADDDMLMDTSRPQQKEMWADAKRLLPEAPFNIGEDDHDKCLVLNVVGKRSTD